MSEIQTPMSLDQAPWSRKQDEDSLACFATPPIPKLTPSFPVHDSRSQWLSILPSWLLQKLYIEASINTKFDQHLIMMYLLVSKF